MNIKKRFQNLKLSTQISIIFMGMFIPTTILLGVWFFNVMHYNNEYAALVRNASTISDFSIDFKNNFDYKIYLIIVGNTTVEKANPMKDIKEAEDIIDQMNLDMENLTNQELIGQNQKYMHKLRKYTLLLENNVAKGGMYDANMKIWDSDIMTITSLIQDNILEILHNETKAIAGVRTQMKRTTTQMVLFSGILLILTLWYAVAAAILVSRTITRPILYLEKLTERVAGGNLQVRSKLETGVEVKKLSDSLNVMIERIGALMDRVKLEQIRLREAELEILQMQINPHFLYNTLDTIVWLAEGGDQKQVVSMVESLSDFFRVSLNQGNDMTTIEEEITHVTSYLKIQKVRYRDIMDYEILIPEELQQYSIPKITLQPLVENALYHGIKNKRGKGTIQIYGRKEPERIVLSVVDNGMGITEKRLKEVRKGIKKRKSQKKRDFFGTYNVNERLRLKFGEAYHLHIESIYGEGTTVEVYLPAVTQADLTEYAAGKAIRQKINRP